MKISVLVPTWNPGPALERALESVWCQTHTDFEVIVMDAASTDGTVAFLKRNSPRIAVWRSEPDAGTTDALNKGLKFATGELVTFLCADDYFADHNVFREVVSAFAKNPKTDWLAASIQVVDSEGLISPHVVKSEPSLMHKRMTVNLPGAFLRTRLLKERQFDSRVEIANDYELFSFLLCERRAELLVLDRVNTVFAAGGRSNSTWTDFRKARDCFFVRRKYFGFWAAWPAYGRDILVSVLRKMGFRPLTWLRLIRRWFSPPPAPNL